MFKPISLAAFVIASTPIFWSAASASSLQTLYSIKGVFDGFEPQAPLLSLGSKLYGTTPLGGTFQNGTAFSFDLATKAYSVISSFPFSESSSYPVAGLTAVGGTLYGTTSGGGAFGLGSVFAIDRTTGAITTLYSFMSSNDANTPYASLLHVGDSLIGTSLGGGPTFGGAVYSVDRASGAESVIHFFSGATGFNLQSPVIIYNGTLYGNTIQGGNNACQGGCGTVFSLDPTTGSETVLYAFAGAADGSSPEGNMLRYGKFLYGTTFSGGSTAACTQGCGVVYKVDLTTDAFTTVHMFTGGNDGAGPEAGVLEVNGTLYGTTSFGGAYGDGAVFAVDPTTGAERVVYSFGRAYDGSVPRAPLINVNGILYGTTNNGGTASNGTIFSLNPTTSEETVLYSFARPPFGHSDFEGLDISNQTLLVTSSIGGSADSGNISEVSTSTGLAKGLYSFSGGADGSTPHGALTKSGAILYGTTEEGGAAFSGTIFEFNRKTAMESVLYSFAGDADGYAPSGSLLVFGGNLYGTTNYGGVHGRGTVFSLNSTSKAKTVLYSFRGGDHDGAYPQDGLVKFQKRLFGTTLSGGPSEDGVLFCLNIDDGKEKVIYSFSGGSDGSLPRDALVNVSGTLYGTASCAKEKKPSCYGSIFSIDPDLETVKILYSFPKKGSGLFPVGRLVSVGGMLYGTTQEGGTNGKGTIFSFDPTTGDERVAYSFTGASDGGGPLSDLITHGGEIFGGTGYGGSTGFGTVFSFTP